MTEAGKISWYRSDGMFAVLLLLAMGIWVISRPPVPIEEVDGRYVNPCCQPILIRHGQITFGSENLHFKLSRMKYGLETRLPRQILVGEDFKVTSRPMEEAGFLFDTDERGFTLLDSKRREYHFIRQ